jgi:hypothetical protein
VEETIRTLVPTGYARCFEHKRCKLVGAALGRARGKRGRNARHADCPLRHPARCDRRQTLVEGE